MAVKDTVKEWLVGHGVWEQYWRRKDEYKANGDKPVEAQRRALAEFYRPDGGSVAGAVSGPSGDPGAVSGESGASSAGKVVVPPAGDDVVDSALMSKDQAFVDRDTSMLKSVKWVASVLGVEGLVPDDAPSPQAWSLYLTYRSKGMWAKFWESFGKAMMPSKVDIENKDRMTDDGREVLSLLDRLERERDAAVLQAGVVGA